MKLKYNMNNIFFSPEFLREGEALYDNLYPSRIIVGDKTKMGADFANILKKLSLNDNFRDSAIQDIIEILRKKENEIIVYEPNIVSDNFHGLKIIRSLSEFKQKSSVILANRITNELKDVLYKIYTRDIFNIN